MRGDFSRDTFDAANGYSRVLFQQGRNLLEADFNEQSAIQRAQLRALADISLGWAGKGMPNFVQTPINPAAGAAAATELQLQFQGWYFAGGVRVKVPDAVTRTVPRPARGEYLLIFLDIFEETVYPAEQPALLEPALDPRDTTLRQRPRWTVQALKVTTLPPVFNSGEEFRTYLGNLSYGRARPGTGSLAARVSAGTTGPASQCDPVAADAYTGIENQLYRVEIHDAVQPDPHDGTKTLPPTYKWSRDNASVVFGVQSFAPDQDKLKVYLRQPVLDASWSLAVGNWVELVPAIPPAANEADDPFARPPSLLQVSDIDPVGNTVTLTLPTGCTAPNDATAYPLLVRWDQQSATGPVPMQFATDPTQLVWQTLEASIQVAFTCTDPRQFRPGDYWLIPARALTGQLIWLSDAHGNPVAAAPRGPEHVYAPLALVDGGEAATGPLTVHPFPWTGITPPAPPTTGWNVDHIALNAATADPDADTPISGDDTTGLKLLDRLNDPSAPAVMRYSLRQMLVIAASDPLGPPPEWTALLESLRRFHLEHKTTLTKLIHDQVNPLLAANTMTNILSTPKAPTTVAGVIGPRDFNLGATPLDTQLTSRLTELLLNALPVIAGLKSADALVNKVKNDPGGIMVSAAQTTALTNLWNAAARVDHYLKAWPYRTMTREDWA